MGAMKKAPFQNPTQSPLSALTPPSPPLPSPHVTLDLHTSRLSSHLLALCKRGEGRGGEARLDMTTSVLLCCRMTSTKIKRL